jgi:lauroyl/myristoyl acyltransferase
VPPGDIPAPPARAGPRGARHPRPDQPPPSSVVTDDHEPALARGWRARSKYLTYRGLAAGMGHLPEPVAEGIARGVARAMALRGSPALAMNERHMQRVLASECAPGVVPDPVLVQRWSRRTFDSYARYWSDGARLPYESEAGVRGGFQLPEAEHHLRRAVDLGRGVVMALPHVGSWEWGGAWLGLERMPMTAVVERLEPEALFEWFVGQRAAMGLTAVPLGDGSSSALLRALKANEIAGLVSDRDLVGNGVEVEFFGEKTTLPAGAAALALRTGAVLLPVVVYSGPGNWHTGVVHPPLDTSRQGRMREDIARVTQDLATTFEHDIRAHPEQWHLYQPNWPSDPR